MRDLTVQMRKSPIYKRWLMSWNWNQRTRRSWFFIGNRRNILQLPQVSNYIFVKFICCRFRILMHWHPSGPWVLTIQGYLPCLYILWEIFLMQIIKATVLVLTTSVWPENNINLIAAFDRMFGKSLVCVHVPRYAASLYEHNLRGNFGGWSWAAAAALVFHLTGHCPTLFCFV